LRQTALLMAAAHGHIAIVQLLINNNADFNERDAV
jgi:ankyrin repeat protein